LPLRIGIINIMPRAEVYEVNLLRPLERAPQTVEPIWIRLNDHRYGSSDAEHLRAHYVSFEDAVREPLDGLILTGAPIEQLEYEEVTYWRELVSILQFARQNIAGTLGLCWGGMALAKLLGIEKRAFHQKLFGVYSNRNLSPGRGYLGESDDTFFCAHSRHSGIRDDDLEQAADRGTVQLLSHGALTGYSVFASTDGRFLMHLGHPEYDAERLVTEWRRDSALGRADVRPPYNFDPLAPANLWRAHGTTLFARWLTNLRSSEVLRDGALAARHVSSGASSLLRGTPPSAPQDLAEPRPRPSMDAYATPSEVARKATVHSDAMAIDLK
jgi:homoserine O-succinyltransferase